MDIPRADTSRGRNLGPRRPDDPHEVADALEALDIERGMAA